MSSDLSMKLRKHLEFYEQRYGYRVFAEAYVTNKYGVVIGSTGRTSDYLQADEDWYQQSVSNRDLWVGDLEFDDSSNSYAIDLVVNLYDDDGNFTGVFKGVLDVAEIENSIKALQATSHHESMAPYLIDKDNLVIFSGLDPTQKELGRDVKLSEFGEDASSRDAVKKLREGYERDSGYLLSTEMRSDEQTKLLSSFSRSNGFRDFKGLGWGVIIEYETSDVLSSVHSLKRIIILVSVGLTLLAIILGLYIARSISRPIRNLTRMAGEISRGNLDASIEKVKSSDEIGQLASSFNEMASQLKTAYGSLEQRVTERTEELEGAKKELEEEIAERLRTERELQTLATNLEGSNRELQDFASVASHDLQEPLRKVRAFGDLLNSGYKDILVGRGQDYLQRMLNATERMQHLIDDLLAFSRVTSKAEKFVPVDLAVVAAGVVDDLESIIEQRGGRVNVGELPTIDADPTQMRQLLQNLISNALKFHKKDQSPLVNIRSESLDGTENNRNGSSTADPLVHLLVEDNGVGFDEKHRDRIFTLFQRLHGRGEFDGTGIGLAICRKIVERHGGTITAKSALGRGSTFMLTLPLRQAKGDNAE